MVSYSGTSTYSPNATLLVAQGVYGVELGGFASGIEAEEYPHGGAEGEGDNDGLRRDQRGPFLDHGNQLRAADAQEDAQDAPG